MASNVRDAHDRLTRELAALPDSERRAVVAAAERAAAGHGAAVATWRSIREAIGVAKGEPADAIEDTARLYDG